jgi:hypothetical protein
MEPEIQEKRQRVQQTLLEAGVIRPRAVVESVEPISEEELERAVIALAKAGPLSEQILADRGGR